MSVLAKQYTDLDLALDEVRSVLQEWSTGLGDDAPDAETMRYTQLVLHEWIANLLQHAEFEGRTPTVQIRLNTENRHVTCTVVDNSEGFDLQEQLPAREEEMEEFPERGMGLRIISACTAEVAYHATEDGQQRFEFSIPADHDPWLSMLF